MTAETRLVDYSFAHEDPAAIARAGIVGVIRYLALMPNPKVITPSEVQALHAHQLTIDLVWESTGNRALQGKTAGEQDRREAERQANALGYPTDCPIYYAVDFDATPEQVAAYFTGVGAVHGTHPAAPYGGIQIVDHFRGGWQTVAWSKGKLSPHAELYQRAGGPLPGTDLDVVCKPLKAWGPHGTVTLTPPGVKPPKPAPKPRQASDFIKPTADALTAIDTAADLVVTNVGGRVKHKDKLTPEARKQAQRAIREMHAAAAVLQQAVDLG